MPAFDPSTAIWIVAALATCGVILRPWCVPEFVWAMGDAILLTVSGLIPPHAALHAIGEGLDVYLFLIGMMLLRFTQRAHLRQPLETTLNLQPLSSGARLPAFGIVLTGIVLLSASARGVQLWRPCSG